MPGAAIAVIAAVAAEATVTALVLTGLSASIVGAVITIGITALGSALIGGSNGSSGGRGTPYSAEARGRAQVIRSAVAPRKIIYGEAKVAGPLTFAATSGSGNKFLHLVIPVASHESTQIPTIFFGDEKVGALDSDGNVIEGRFKNRARIKLHLGIPGQVADPDLVAEVEEWTEDHIGKGITYLYVRLKHDNDVYPHGIPNISVILKGKKVFDPRTSLTELSDNWGLCITDFLKSREGGFEVLDSEIEEANTIAQANLSDEEIAFAGEQSLARSQVVSGSNPTKFVTRYFPDPSSPDNDAGGGNDGVGPPTGGNDDGGFTGEDGTARGGIGV